MASRAREPLYRPSSSRGWQAPKPAPSGRPLRAPEQARFGSGFGIDLSGVRVHDDETAARSAEALAAKAFTVGRDIYFAGGAYRPGTACGDRLLAHELAHTLQQGGASPPGASAILRPASAAEEREADAAADAVLLGQHAWIRSGGSEPRLAKRDAEPPADVAARVIAALNGPRPLAGVADSAGALSILGTLTGEALVAAVIEVDRNGLLDALLEEIPATDKSPAAAVAHLIRASASPGAPDLEHGKLGATALGLLAQQEQDVILTEILVYRGVSADLEDLREGIAAIEGSVPGEAELDPLNPDMDDDGGQLTAGVEPGPAIAGMPFPFLIGNAAHLVITEYYDKFHPGQLTSYNYTPISTILAKAIEAGMKVNPAALSKAQRLLRPDIANLTKMHLYEIKPHTLQWQGAVEAAGYVGAFAAAGLPVMPGPENEPGTTGFEPAPNNLGSFSFTCVMPGVITYNFRPRPGKRVTEPVKQRKPQTEKQPQYQFKPIEYPLVQPYPSADPSMIDRIVKTTGVSVALAWVILILMILLSPVGV